MRTPLCDMFGIEYPIFAFTHCRDVVAAVSKAGGLGVLGAVGFSPEQLEIELDWIDEHINGMPYGVDTVMPQKAVDVHGADAEDMLAQIRSMIDANHWRYVDELMERFELPSLSEGQQPGGVLGWNPTVDQHTGVAVSALSAVDRDRVQTNSSRGSLATARSYVQRLQASVTSTTTTSTSTTPTTRTRTPTTKKGTTPTTKRPATKTTPTTRKALPSAAVPKKGGP